MGIFKYMGVQKLPFEIYDYVKKNRRNLELKTILINKYYDYYKDHGLEFIFNVKSLLHFGQIK